eukprot:8845341-Alexandrium_andersonii.AAC.1
MTLASGAVLLRINSCYFALVGGPSGIAGPLPGLHRLSAASRSPMSRCWRCMGHRGAAARSASLCGGSAVLFRR